MLETRDLLAGDTLDAVPLKVMAATVAPEASTLAQVTSKSPDGQVSNGLTSVALDGIGSLYVTDVSDVPDTLTIRSDTNLRRFVVTDATKTLTTTIPGATGDGTQQITVPFELVTGAIVVDTRGGTDSLTLDLTVGNFSKEVIYYPTDPAALRGNTVVVSGGGQYDRAVFDFLDNHRRTIDLTGNATIRYRGTEPLVSSVVTNHVTLQHGREAQGILLTQDGANTLVYSTEGENVQFTTPPGILTINGGASGDDVVRVAGAHELGGGSLAVSAREIVVEGVVATALRGYIHLNADQSVLLHNSARIQTEDGDIRLSGNIGPVAADGDFIGVHVDDLSMISTSTGNILLEGRGGNIAGRTGKPVSRGVSLSGSSIVESTGTGRDTGIISIVGVTRIQGALNPAVELRSVGTTVRSVDGDIEIMGDGSQGNEQGKRVLTGFQTKDLR